MVRKSEKTLKSVVVYSNIAMTKIENREFYNTTSQQYQDSQDCPVTEVQKQSSSRSYNMVTNNTEQHE